MTRRTTAEQLRTTTLGRSVVVAGLVVASLAIATAAAAFLEGVVGIPDASPVYLVPVVLLAALEGTWPAIATSLLAFVIYDYLFTSPQFTLSIADPAEWLSLLLFLLIAVVIGRLAALLRERAEVADRRSRESVAITAISRTVTMAATFDEAAAAIAERLRADTEMTTLSIQAGEALPAARPVPWTLFRSPDGSSDWVRVLRGVDATASDGFGPDVDAYLVPIEVDGRHVGTIVATRPTGDARPGRGARRILSSAADLLGMAFRRDELRDEITAAEVARQGDALRTAILDSVSHDLRTPLASIRALAGGLLDRAGVTSDDGVRETADAIDHEAARMGDLVRGLLEMSRIQAGAVDPDVEAYDLGELVETAVRRVARDAGRRIAIAIGDELPPVAVDAVLFDVALSNVLDNALRYAPSPARIAIGAEPIDDSTIALRIDDAGPGVPDAALGQLFERFYRLPGGRDHPRHGLGIGLAIARGFIEAIGGSIDASRSPLGGLRVTMHLPAAMPPGGDSDDASRSRAETAT